MKKRKTIVTDRRGRRRVASSEEVVMMSRLEEERRRSTVREIAARDDERRYILGNINDHAHGFARLIEQALSEPTAKLVEYARKRTKMVTPMMWKAEPSFPTTYETVVIEIPTCRAVIPLPRDGEHG